MNFQKAFSSVWMVLTRTRFMRFAVTVFAIFVAVRYFQNARAGRHGGGRRGTRRHGASSSRSGGSRRNASMSSSQRAQRAADEDVKNRHPSDVYLTPSRRRYQICISSSCVFSAPKSPGNGSAALSEPPLKLATDALPQSGDDERKDDFGADASTSSLSESTPLAAKQRALGLKSEQCYSILLKLCEHHDLYLVCQLDGPSSSSQQASSGDGKSAFSSSSTSAPHDEATKEIIDFCREMSLFDAGLKKHRVVFCTTDIGRTAIMRQLEPHLLIEDNSQNAQQLSKVLPNSRVVITSLLGEKNARVTDVDGFESFFAKE